METPGVPAERAHALSTLAADFVNRGATRGITLRLIGSIAIRARCSGRADVFEQLEREPPLDIDLVGYSKQQSQIDGMFKELGYRIDPTIAQSQEWGIQRLIYHRPDGELKVDIFLDVLRMSHTIDFKGRLDLTPLTVSAADLLLAKLQIFRITEKDLKDIVALILVDDSGSIDLQYVLTRLRGDWGLYYTASKNIALAQSRLDTYPGLAQQDATTVRGRLARLQELLNEAPKTLRWRLRAAIGPRMQWYEEVEDVDR